ncbi:piggyBac transposable element-derived protein 3-like [Eurosta solidaginis]|uniref:piggyBac transposable element-derived protein 3-like n=1 Tax=Eurosta solidaginis TaxID=178769 RepID=UPI00353080E4
MDIDTKSNEFKKILWRKGNMQKHLNEVSFLGDLSLSDEIISLDTPYKCFAFFFTDDLFESIVHYTNWNANRQDIEGSFCVTVTEMRKFLGILIYMSVIRMPSADRYWGRHTVAPVKKAMSSKRFYQIRKYLCFNDFSKMKKIGEPGYDTQFKIRPIIDYLNQRFDMVPKKPRLCVDEQMCVTKMHSRFRQYLPNKPHKWGMKFFVLCDSDGYAYRFELYSGAGDNIIPNGYPDLGATSNVVVRLTETVPAMINHIVYFDNFYTSLPLLVLLKSKGIYALGTIKFEQIPNCKLPSDKDSKLKRGEVVEYIGSASGLEIATIQWKDTKNVRLASTSVGTLPFFTSNSQAEPRKVIRYDRKDKNYLEVDCPHIINGTYFKIYYVSNFPYCFNF